MIERIADLLSPHGLILRGGFNFATGEARPARSVLLVGHGGAGFWPHFQAWRSDHRNVADPLDTWSRSVIDDIATRVGARACYPNDRPYLPFQNWAMRAEGLKPSPLGILMHPRFGLWHAYRGALLFEHNVRIGERPEPHHPCEACEEKPCLAACPVGAFGAGGYAVDPCRRHVRADGVTCREQGCIARNACPHGQGFRYPPDIQARFMASFLGA